MASTISPHSSASASSRAQLRAASRSLAGSWWSSSVFWMAWSDRFRIDWAIAGPAAARAPGLSRPGGGGKVGHD